jgi:AbrB family looped-hinge helix DNA binding protein
MSRVISITSQGQVNIPKAIRDAFNLKGATKAVIEKKGDVIIIRPKNDFWSLANSLKSEVKLSDDDMATARKEFSKSWPIKK